MPDYLLSTCAHGFERVIEITHWHEQHTKTFAFGFGHALMMHFVGFANGAQIHTIRIAPQLETLMYKDVMHHKVGKPVGSNAEAYPNPKVPACHYAKHDKQPAWYGKYQKKTIVFFEKLPFAYRVMVFVQIPQKAVHNVFMRCPSHKFH